MTTKKKTTVPAKRGHSVVASMAQRYHTDGAQLLETLKNTVFKKATNEQLMALCIVADQHKLNPFTKEIYAFPDKDGGIVPVVGIDGWGRIINDQPQYDGMDIDDADPERCTVTMFRKDRNHPTTATEYMDECRRNTPAWKSHPRRMLRHKAVIQCARLCFGLSLKDPDEAESIMDAQAAEERVPVDMPRVVAVDNDQDDPVDPDAKAETTKADALPDDLPDDLPL